MIGLVEVREPFSVDLGGSISRRGGLGVDLRGGAGFGLDGRVPGWEMKVGLLFDGRHRSSRVSGKIGGGRQCSGGLVEGSAKGWKRKCCGVG